MIFDSDYYYSYILSLLFHFSRKLFEYDYYNYCTITIIMIVIVIIIIIVLIIITTTIINVSSTGVMTL